MFFLIAFEYVMYYAILFVCVAGTVTLIYPSLVDRADAFRVRAYIRVRRIVRHSPSRRSIPDCISRVHAIERVRLWTFRPAVVAVFAVATVASACGPSYPTAEQIAARKAHEYLDSAIARDLAMNDSRSYVRHCQKHVQSGPERNAHYDPCAGAVAVAESLDAIDTGVFVYCDEVWAEDVKDCTPR